MEIFEAGRITKHFERGNLCRSITFSAIYLAALLASPLPRIGFSFQDEVDEEFLSYDSSSEEIRHV